MLNWIRSFSDLWTPIGLVWLLLGTGTLILLWKRKWLAASVCCATVVLLSVIGAEWPAGLMAGLEKPYARSSLADVPTNDVVVVLGGSHQRSRFGVFGLDLADASDRIVTGLELMRQGKGQALVLGGGAFTENGAQHPYSALLRAWLDAWKMPGKPVFDLGTSMNTREEALAFERLAKDHNWSRVTLVTSASHMRRSEAVFRNVGFPVVCVAADFRAVGIPPPRNRLPCVPHLDRIEMLDLYLHEVVGWTLYRWKGWTIDHSQPSKP